MQLPRQLGALDFSNWVYGLGAAFIGGGSGAFSAGLSVIIVDPHDFTIWTLKFWQVVGSTFVISGLAPFFAYLHTQPLPTKIVTTTTQTLEPGPPQTKTTVIETHTETMKGDK